MNAVLKKRNCFAALVFTASALSLFHGSVCADECPSEDFTQFLPAFSANAETQQRLTAMTVKSLVLKPTGEHGDFEPQTSGVNSAAFVYPLMVPVLTDKTDGVEVEKIDDSHVNVVDKRAGTSNIKIFNFSRQACWVLEGIEDWSISEEDLAVASKPDMSKAENICFQRAEAFRGLGGLEQYRLTGELFEASLENYLCAAASGDPQASLNAASLSLSGMAPQLETEKVKGLFEAAATTLPEGAMSLSLFYCQGNNLSSQGPCQHPDQAEEALTQAARMGSAFAINALGRAFETGEFVTKDMSRAVACYQLAAKQGSKGSIAHLKRLNTQPAEALKASYCY
ncbi:tetratricopeptide repeat protein [Pseudomonas prosekii]|uniref:Sel1 repeat family protein n=1 Tax=Pseudomonas prosekii TaxID=1148509 RepID=A0A2U2DA48_9PSED|nr:sel1 repeat family protein [Pseudomonas prosekii]PWE45918.1 hypothetical protein C9I49_09345 [Pseudomonas prosekii]